MRVGGDERRRATDRDANAVTALAISLAAIIGVVIDTAPHGDPGALN
jgi:hypothetical protein